MAEAKVHPYCKDSTWRNWRILKFKCVQALKSKYIKYVLLVLFCFYILYNIDDIGKIDIYQKKTAAGMFRNIVYRKEHDLLSLPPYKFDPNYKNPCWFENTIRGRSLRCLPYMYLLGVKKCGTSDLFQRIVENPHVADTGWKESQWLTYRRFTPGYINHNKEWFVNSSITTYIQAFHRATQTIQSSTIPHGKGKQFHHMIVGDATPSYFHYHQYWPIMPGNEGLDEPKYTNFDYIRHLTPDAKLIVIVRDPVQRYYSDYLFKGAKILKRAKKRSVFSAKDFHRKAVANVNKFSKCFKKYSVRRCAFTPEQTPVSENMFQIGFYSVFLEDLYRVFPRNQTLVLRTEDYSQNMADTLQKVFKFLKITPLRKGTMDKTLRLPKKQARTSKAQRVGEMLPATRDLLYEFFQPLNDRMVELLGDEAFRYRNPYK